MENPGKLRNLKVKILRPGKSWNKTMVLESPARKCYSQYNTGILPKLVVFNQLAKT